MSARQADAGFRALRQARRMRCEHLQMEDQIRRHGSGRGQALKDAGGDENTKMRWSIAEPVPGNSALKDLLDKK